MKEKTDRDIKRTDRDINIVIIKTGKGEERNYNRMNKNISRKSKWKDKGEIYRYKSIKTRKRYHRYNILIIIVIPKKDIILGMIEKIKITNLNININNNTNNKWIKIRKDVYKDREIPEDILIITTNKWSP